MIHFLLRREHAYTVKHVLESGKSPPVRTINYDRLIRATRLRRGTYIFTDLDRLSHWDRELVAAIYLQLKSLGFRVLNNPARVKTRYSLLRALHAAGLNDFNIWRGDDLSGSIRFPVFLRNIHGHGDPLTGLLQSRDELNRAIETAVNAGIPLESIVAIEFAAEPVQPGVYRKLAAFRMGDAIVPHIAVHDTEWLVKYGRKFDTIENLYQEENQILRTNRHSEHLRKAFDIADIEYGRADFGICRGRIQIYEINTNPTIPKVCEHPSALRIENMTLADDLYFAGLRTLESGDGRLIELPQVRKLKRYRSWKNIFVRTRRVP